MPSEGTSEFCCESEMILPGKMDEDCIVWHHAESSLG
jgi:hypothetical protein